MGLGKKIRCRGTKRRVQVARVGSEVQLDPVEEVFAGLPDRWSGKCTKALLAPPHP